MISKSPRPGFHTMTPYLTVQELEPYLTFLRQAFGASEHFRAKGGAGGTHVELRIGDSMVMVGGSRPKQTVPTTASMLFLYLKEVDAVYQAALAAGATSLMPPTDGAFGEPRGAGIQDPAGHAWYFANWTARPDAPPAYDEPAPAPVQSQPDVIPMLTYEDGAAAMDWLAKAFGFREVTRWLDSEGRLSHGEMITGSGRIMLATPTPAYQSPKHHREECATAHAWAQVPWVIDGVLVYVADVDAHFAQAQQAGTTMLSEIEDGFPGRRYRAEDGEGHRWMFMQRA